MCHVTTILQPRAHALHEHRFAYVGTYQNVYGDGAGYVYQCTCGETVRSLLPPVAGKVNP